MAPGERAQRMALMLLKELMGVQHLTENDDERLAALVKQTSEAARDAGSTLKDLLSVTVYQLERADPALFARFKSFAARIGAA